MIRIMHVITDLEQGGAEGMLVRLVQRLDRGLFSQTVVSLTNRGVYGDIVEDSSIPLITLGMTDFTRVPIALGRLSRIVKEHRPDIVQTWLYHADMMGLLGARLACDVSVAWNIRCGGLDPGYVPYTTRWLVRILAKFSSQPDAIIFNSVVGKEAHLAIGYHPKCSLVIPNGFDLEVWRPDETRRAKFRAEIRVDDSIFLVGMIGRSHQMKGQSSFLAAAARLKEMGKAVRFVLAGRDFIWSNKSLVANIDRYGLRNQFVLLGPRLSMHDVMPGLDCLVSTSTSEGFPNVIGEAMACGVPCVATNAGDSAIIVGDTGRIVPLADVEGVVKGVVKGVEQLMSAGREERAISGLRCRRRIEERFELSNIAARYGEFYKELDENRKRK